MRRAPSLFVARQLGCLADSWVCVLYSAIRWNWTVLAALSWLIRPIVWTKHCLKRTCLVVSSTRCLRIVVRHISVAGGSANNGCKIDLESYSLIHLPTPPFTAILPLFPWNNHSNSKQLVESNPYNTSQFLSKFVSFNPGLHFRLVCEKLKTLPLHNIRLWYYYVA